MDATASTTLKNSILSSSTSRRLPPVLTRCVASRRSLDPAARRCATYCVRVLCRASRSTVATRCPQLRSATATCIAIVDLPAPSLGLPSTMTCADAGCCGLDSTDTRHLPSEEIPRHHAHNIKACGSKPYLQHES